MNAVVTWVPVNGSSYEIWYAKLSTVGATTVPPSTGWTQATGSPFDSSLGTGTISGLDDNTQYRIEVRSDCMQNDSQWVDNIEYKVICPTLSLTANPVSSTDVGASITASVSILNYMEFESIGTSITLTVTKVSDSSIVATKVFTAPYAGPTLTNIFSGLLVNTNYSVSIVVHNGITSTDITCTAQSTTTQSPVVVPPPVCNPPTFSITNVTASSATININGLSAGDVYNISLDGGATFPITGTATPYNLTGLVAGTSYSIVVRLNCATGGIGITTSQTFTTTNALVLGTVSMNSNINSTTAPFATIGTLFLTFTFPAPTPAPMTLYFGFVANEPVSTSVCSAGTGYYANGTSIFTLPSKPCYIQPTNFVVGYDTSGTGAYPFVVTIPQGVTSYNSGTSIHTSYTGQQQNPWRNYSSRNALGSSGHVALGYTDLYVRVQSPAGYNAAFTIVQTANIQGVTLHNV